MYLCFLSKGHGSGKSNPDLRRIPLESSTGLVLYFLKNRERGAVLPQTHGSNQKALTTSSTSVSAFSFQHLSLFPICPYSRGLKKYAALGGFACEIALEIFSPWAE
jgi:hypothetical protein